jgi:DNA-binding NtrC family response regulator
VNTDDAADSPAEAAADTDPEGRTLRLLVVDDDEFDRLAVRRFLKASSLRTSLDEAATQDEALDHLAGNTYDCILLDYYIPGVAGHALLAKVRDVAPEVPVVIFTGRGDEEVAVEMMKAGATDYLPKASLTPERLGASLRHAFDIARAAAARRRAEAELRERDAERGRLLLLEQARHEAARRGARDRRARSAQSAEHHRHGVGGAP